jgi:hypothetical protein
MKINFTNFLFFILFIKIILNEEFEKSVKIHKKLIDNVNVNINYIITTGDENDEKKFLINPNSKNVVLFKKKTDQIKNRRLASEESEYFEFFNIEIKEIVEEPINFFGLNIPVKYAHYYNDKNDYEKLFFGAFTGYIGINKDSILFEQIKKEGGGFSKIFGVEIDQNSYNYIFGKEYEENDDLTNIQPAIKDNDELSLSMSHFTLEPIKKIKDKYQYTIEKDNDKYFDLKTKTFISYILADYHIATNTFINKIVEKFKLKVELSAIKYFNIELTKYKVECDNDKKNFTIIFDSSTAINLQLMKNIKSDDGVNEECELLFLGYYYNENNSTDALFLSSNLMEYNVSLNFEDNIVYIEGDSEKFAEIESMVPLVLFFVSVIIVIIVIIGVIYIIKKNKINNSIDENSQDSNSSGLVPG